MALGWLLERMKPWGKNTAIIWRDRRSSYRDLLELVAFWEDRLQSETIGRGAVVALEGDYSPHACALMLALVDRDAIVVPLTRSVEAHREDFLRIAEVEWVITLDTADKWRVQRRKEPASHPLIRQLVEGGEPGLVLFSSGSTGKNKAALHNFHRLLEKFQVHRQRMTTLTFLLLDHIGGINTLLYTFSNGGTVVATESREPEEVCTLVERYGVELIPTSPTFLNLVLLSEAYKRHDLSSLRLVTYGTEVMPESTLLRLHEAMPGVTLQQTYGLSELGILRSKSKDSGSRWVKVGGEGFETKVVDGTLWIRARSAMLGYLNAPSPFDAEGWMNTGDLVEVDGEYIRILGRKSEIINVGGQKVSPVEVESVLMQMENVRDVTVYGEANPITGHMVVARVKLGEPEDPRGLTKRIRAFCKGKLAPHEIPVKIEVVGGELFSARFKKIRQVTGAEPVPEPSRS